MYLTSAITLRSLSTLLASLALSAALVTPAMADGDRRCDDDAGETTPETTDPTPPPTPAPECGDGNIDEAETCDDGNTDADDGCSSDCVVEDDYECLRADFSLLADEYIGDVKPDWSRSEDAFTVVQSDNPSPSVYATTLPANDIGEITLTMQVEDDDDNDYVGLVLGFESGELESDDASFLLIDWRRQDQDKFNGVPARRGMAVSLVTGKTSVTDLAAHRGSVRELARAEDFSDAGWSFDDVYTWTLTYSADHLHVAVNGDTQFDLRALDLDVNFPEGTLGFYNFSQRNVTYELLSPRGVSLCSPIKEDLCPGFDDALDADGDGTPDGCDVCPNSAYVLDSDSDGVCDDIDVCPGADDKLDSDGDGTPNGCDFCSNGAGVLDSDGDGVCDEADVCAGSDDKLDADADGTPDACDVCPEDAGNDVDGDGICAAVDNCPDVANIDQYDFDGDGWGDACEDERYGVQGGGCSAGKRNGTTGTLLVILTLGLWWERRRRAAVA
ncbi:hypothetical protein [Haliangium sp.]|uniref:hypothetical protein n=1 Tax=Haliangium sp. TaxID=2663208 RepID=UPI003D0BED6A